MRCNLDDMTTRLEKVIRRVESLSQAEQDAIAAQIQDTLDDEAGWKQRFATKRDRLREMAREALAEDSRGETRPLDELL